MPQPFSLDVVPTVPPALSRLPELASNLFFSWHRPTRALFESLDRQLWAECHGNPKRLLRSIAQETLDRAAGDPATQARYSQVLEIFDAYVKTSPLPDAPLVAYFCAEYGLTSGFPIYSGGLGVLAGDHCKAASDERLNFIAVGLLYGQGYFTQVVDSEGAQLALFRDYDPRDLPVEPVRLGDGAWLSVAVRMLRREVLARVWQARIGRVTLYLLDTNCEPNSPEDRVITWRLYGGDDAMRIRQEMLLGIGGVRALRALGLTPAVFHLNEGHAAFLTLELLREHALRGVDHATALEAVAAQSAFTTHTPVAAGHDQFGQELLLAHFADYPRELGLTADQFLALGRAPSSPNMFNMTRLALRSTRRVNGVSRIHGLLSQQLLADQWPEVPARENPVGYITNGVHVPTFLHQKWSEFFDEAAGPHWRERLSDRDFWRFLERVPDSTFWATSQTVKSDMLACVRERLRLEYARKGQSPAQLRLVAKWLDPAHPDVLTIGFARRFATYKRAALLLQDRERLARIVNDPQRPVVFLFAGKAHPADQPGQAVLREIKQLMLDPRFMGRIIFLEDYDIQLARWLVSGVDIWLNNPIAPLEASGTSGIKAAVNGRQNLSVLDGWWAEACDDTNGWGIPPVDVRDPARRDAMEAELIFNAIEEEAVALYYERSGAGYSRDWVQRCKRAMMTVIPQFNMRRMVADYVQGVYAPAADQGRRLASAEMAGARSLAAWKARVRGAWPKVQMRALNHMPDEVPVNEPLRLRVAVMLGELTPNDVCVEFVARRTLPEAQGAPPALASHRPAGGNGNWSAKLRATGEAESDGAQVFALDASLKGCGHFEGELRVHPQHDLLTHAHEMGLMKWLS